MAQEHRLKVASVRYILKKARKKPEALLEMVSKHHDEKAAEADLQEHLTAKIDACANIDNAE